jgi:hypothetical protein
MASGIATVAFDYGAAREHLCNQVHGAAVSVGDEPGFVEAFVQTATRPDLARAGANARDAVLHLHPMTVARDFAALLGALSERREAA